MNFEDALANIRESLSQNSQLKIVYNPNIACPENNCVLIGVGKSDPDARGLVLNQKGTKWGSVTELIYNADEKTVSSWRSSIDFKQTHFFLEDLSPDTCLAFVIFHCRYNRVPLDQIPANWVDYVHRWEAGDVKTTGEPFKSWGSLHNALGHMYLGKNHSDEKPLDQSLHKTSFREGFEICIEFVIELLLTGESPYNVPQLYHVNGYIRAVALLNYEFQQYKTILRRATVIQLQLPIRDSMRKLLVDAIITQDNVALGALKVFARNDHENTWLKSGFGLMGIYKPELRGTGNDIVITVEPSLDIHLKDLWLRLEELETERWCGQTKRPDKNPRFKEKSPFDQPWYDEMGRCTLIAAPKLVSTEPKVYGSKLEWEDVINVLWELYNPVQDLKVIPYKGSNAPCPIHEAKALISDEISGKQMIPVKWNSGQDLHSFVITPTMKRYLAACVKNSNLLMPTLEDLPPELDFDFLELPGGFAVIHANGVLLLDDWTKDQLTMKDLKKEFENLIERYKLIELKKPELSNLIEDIKSSISKNRMLKDLVVFTKIIAEHKIDLRQTILNTMSVSNEYNVQIFRSKIESRWAVSSQLDDLYKSVAEVENILKGYSEANVNKLVSNLTIYGFPLMFFGGLFSFVFTSIQRPSFLGIHIYGFVAFVGLSIMGIFFIHSYLRSLTKARKMKANSNQNQLNYSPPNSINKTL